MDSVILHEIAISLLSLSLPTHAYRLEISPRWQWPDLASIRPPHISIVALRLNCIYSRCANCQTSFVEQSSDLSNRPHPYLCAPTINRDTVARVPRPSIHLCTMIQMRVFIVTYLCSVVGVYSCAVDAQQCIRALRRVGCVGATVCEARLNAETTTGECLLANGGTSEI